jgi:hypothetical protein
MLLVEHNIAAAAQQRHHAPERRGMEKDPEQPTEGDKADDLH